MNICVNEIPDKHISVEYYLESRTTLLEAAHALAIGQSIGNPNVRNEYETDELVQLYSAKIVMKDGIDYTKNKGKVTIAFPAININWETDGISQLLCDMIGGQVDIEIIKKCHVLDINLHDNYEVLTPKFGIKGIRKITGVKKKPILGCIIKPKIGLKPQQLVSIVEQMIDGGANIVKEDEIMCNPSFAPYEERIPLIAEAIKGTNVIYLATTNGDAHKILDTVKNVHSLGSNGIHINIWSGLGTYSAVRKMDLPVVMHYHKSGEKVITHKKNPYRISWLVLCKLAAWSGIDTIHAGMWSGYVNDSPTELKKVMRFLQKNNVLPSLSGGLSAKNLPAVYEKFGYNFLANIGGGVHVPGLTLTQSVKQLRTIIDEL